MDVLLSSLRLQKKLKKRNGTHTELHPPHVCRWHSADLQGQFHVFELHRDVLKELSSVRIRAELRNN